MANLKNDSISIKLDLEAQEAQENIHKLSKEIENLNKQNSEHRKEISRLAAMEGDYSAEIKRLNETIRANSKEINNHKNAIDEERKKIDISRLSASDLKKELRKLQSQLANTSKGLHPEKWKETEEKINRYKEALKRAEQPTRSLLDKFKTLPSVTKTVEGAFLAVGAIITDYIAGAFKNLIGTIQDFESANSKLASILGTNIDGIYRLTDQAKLLGRTTTATASDVTGLQTELAKLGFVQNDIENMTPAVLKFAKAVDTDLSRAAAFAGATLRIFHKESSETENVLASFAVATTKTALDFSKLETSLSIVGPVAQSAGFSLEETTALLGTLANNGFDASSAATALRNIFLKVADTSSDLSKAFGEPVTNIDELRAGLIRLENEGVDLQKALEMTDKRSVAAFMSIMKGAGDLDSLRDSLTNCTGEFKNMSKTMADNAAGSWAGFQSAVEGLVLKFFDFRVVLQTFYEWATEVVNWIGEIIDLLAPLGEIIKFIGVLIGGLISTIGNIVGGITHLITQHKAFRVILNTVVATLIGYKTAALLASSATKNFLNNIVNIRSAVIKYIKGLFQKKAATVVDTVATEAATVATKSFNKALLSNPITIVIGLIGLLVSAIIEFTSAADEATEKTDAWSEASNEASKQYGEQKGKIEALILVAENENISLERRKRAIDELNRIIPGYNAKIDETTKKYSAANEKLEIYLANLEKEMRYKANEKKLQELVSAAEAARDALDNAIIFESENKYIDRFWGKTYNMAAKKAVEEAQKTYDKAEEDLTAFKSRFTKSVEEGIIANPISNDPANTEDSDEDSDKNTSKGIKSIGAAANNSIEEVRKLKDELKSLRKQEANSLTEYQNIEKRKAEIQKRLRILYGKNPQNSKHPVGTYSEDSISEATAAADDIHQKNLLAINMDKDSMSQADYVIKKNQELIRYCGDLQIALTELRKNVSQSHTQTLDKITAEENKIALQLVNAQQEINKAMVQKDKDYHDQRKEANEAFYNQQSNLIRASLIADNELEEASAVYLMGLDRQTHKEQLKELRRYYDEVAAADYYSKDEKTKILKQLGKDIQQVQSQILTDTGKFSEALREAMTDSTSAEGIKAGFTRQINALKAYYAALEHEEGVSADDIVALEEEKQRRIAALNYQYQEQMWQIKELTGLSWGEEYEQELDQLENYHRQGLIKEKDYQRKKLELGVNNAKKYFDYYSQLSGSMFTALQDAEIAQSDTKYDVLIQQAKNNGEDTAALEEEKENKKLEIQKKYADVNFAIKISQIVADTAVSIMRAFSDLGPIGGAVAAALMTATGIAQVIQAKAERDKVKNMQPGRSVSGSSAPNQPATAERVLSGYSEGGYTGDGDRYEVAGVVHRGEYVVPKPIMNNPRVVDAVGTIEAIRRNKLIGAGIPTESNVAGYADGGYTASTPAFDATELREAINEFRNATKNIRAYVVFKDIENAQDTMDRARAPFTRK